MKEKIAVEEGEAFVRGKSLPVSTKFAVEVCSFIRGKGLVKAKRMLSDVIEMKAAVPFRRFKKDLCHKAGKGFGPGRYPIKTAKYFLNLLESAQSNAESKGLNVDDLVIKVAIANRASGGWHYGRLRRRRMKSTHVEIAVGEKKKKEAAGLVKKND